MSTISEHSLSAETWREYVWIDPATGDERTYHIDGPQTLYTHDGATTHRVLDSTGVVHCVPAVGQHGCVLRWLPRDAKDPVQF